MINPTRRPLAPQARPQAALVRYQGPTGSPVRALAHSYSIRMVVFILLHIPLAYAMDRVQALARIHAVITLVLAVFWLLTHRDPQRLISLTAYVTGAEVLWRMTGGDVSWESAKYAVAIFLILATLKYRRLLVADKRPIAYFLLLLPSCLLLPAFDRQAIAFNLSGPLALAVATMFFSTVRLSKHHLQQICLAILAPVVGSGYLATFSTLTAEELVFGRGSSWIAAGDYGPNQMSAILGLGALVALLFAVTDREHGLLRAFVLVCSLWLAAQAALTFSRGGVWTALGAMLVVALYVVRDSHFHRATTVGTTMLLLLAGYLLIPALDNFTGGALASRYTSLDLTGRDLIVRADLLAFRDNPLFGVGPGQSRAYHAILYQSAMTHTEFSRLLAEHGTLGLISLLILLALALQHARIPAPPLQKAYIVSLTVWAMLYMLHAAMRLVAPSFVFGLAAATFVGSAQVTSKVV